MILLLQLFTIAATAAPAPQAPSGTATCAASTPSSVTADLSDSTDSIFLPWAGGFSNTNTPRVAMNIEGVGDITMSTDSGSTGILLSKESIKDYDTLAKDALTVPHYLSSSSRLYTGKLLPLKISFAGKSLADGSDMTASGTVPVLGVEKLVTCPWYDSKSKAIDCPPRPAGDNRTSEIQDSTGIQYMGVGFGHQDTDPKAYSMPSTNSFLNMDTISTGTNPATARKRASTSIRAGWIISTKGVVLGLTDQNTQNVDWEALPPGGLQTTTEPRDWKAVPAAVSLDQKSIGGVSTCDVDSSCFVQGTVLVDTGLQLMYVRMPKDNYKVANAKNSDGTSILPKGTVLTTSFNAPCNTSFAGSYTFTVGDGSEVEPSFAQPLEFVPENGAYVNTGRDFLSGFDIAYDAVGGRFGLRTAGAVDGLDKILP